MLPLFFPVRKFLQLPVQEAMGFLTRPVTGYGAHDHTGDHEYTDDYEGSLHHASVPCMLPSTMLITTAKQNRPLSMYNKSI